jgi:hypothetical protein
MEFVVINDGKTPNTHAFEFAIFYLHSYVDKEVFACTFLDANG